MEARTPATSPELPRRQQTHSSTLFQQSNPDFLWVVGINENIIKGEFEAVMQKVSSFAELQRLLSLQVFPNPTIRLICQQEQGQLLLDYFNSLTSKGTANLFFDVTFNQYQSLMMHNEEMSSGLTWTTIFEALKIALSYGHDKIIEFFLEKLPPPHVQPNVIQFLSSALYIAIEAGSLKHIQSLIAHGADPGFEFRQPGIELTPMHYAVKMGRGEIVVYLLSLDSMEGCLQWELYEDIAFLAIDAKRPKILNLLLTYSAPHWNQLDGSLLCRAISTDDKEMRHRFVSIILGHRQVNIRDDHEAMYDALDKNDLPLMEKLIHAGAPLGSDPRKKRNGNIFGKMTPLKRSLVDKKYSAALFLLKAGMQTLAPDIEETCPNTLNFLYTLSERYDDMSEREELKKHFHFDIYPHLTTLQNHFIHFSELVASMDPLKQHPEYLKDKEQLEKNKELNRILIEKVRLIQENANPEDQKYLDKFITNIERHLEFPVVANVRNWIKDENTSELVRMFIKLDEFPPEETFTELTDPKTKSEFNSLCNRYVFTENIAHICTDSEDDVYIENTPSAEEETSDEEMDLLAFTLTGGMRF